MYFAKFLRANCLENTSLATASASLKKFVLEIKFSNLPEKYFYLSATLPLLLLTLNSCLCTGLWEKQFKLVMKKAALLLVTLGIIVRRCFTKKALLAISESSQENNCAGVPLSIKVQAGGKQIY